MNIQDLYPAGQVEPGWQVLMGDQWLVVGVVIESETPDGTRWISILFRDVDLPAVRHRKIDRIPARPPHLPPVIGPEA